MTKLREKKFLNLLLSGKHPQSKKYAGKHVLVVDEKVIPFAKGKKGICDVEKLEKKYGKTPTLVFVPRKDVSYILSCEK